MRRQLHKQSSILRWFARMHSIHAVLIAVASFGAVLPSARLANVSSVVHVDAQEHDAGDTEEDDRDRNQNQDQDSDQDQDRDVTDLTKLFVASESEQDDFLAPELVLISRRSTQAEYPRTGVSLQATRHSDRTLSSAPRPVYTRTCRLML